MNPVGVMVIPILSFEVFLLIAVLLTPLLITLVAIIHTRNSGIKRGKSSWAKLAKANDLIFVPHIFSEKDYIAGSYRGRHLTLETVQKPPYGIHTRITLSSAGQMDLTGEFSPKNTSVINNLPGLEEAVHRLTSVSLDHGQIKVEAFCQKIYYEKPGIENNAKYLQSQFDLLSDLADAYPGIVSLGGEIVSSLLTIASDKNHWLQQVATQLLHDIGLKTTNRLSDSTPYLLCPQCLVHCSAHKIRLSLLDSNITYYGCRVCNQSKEFLEINGQVVAILDSQITTKQIQDQDNLQVNWLHHRKLFDFDQVQIIQATDEDVERFAVQVGNDTDPVRQPKYKQMTCTIAPDCQLSENTMRILRNTFGNVEVKVQPQ